MGLGTTENKPVCTLQGKVVQSSAQYVLISFGKVIEDENESKLH